MGHTGSPGGGAFAFRMREAMVRRRGYEDGHADRRAEDGSAQVAGSAVDEHTRAQPDAFKSCAVCAQRDLVVAAALDIIPGGRLYKRLSKGFVVAEVDWLQLRFLSCPYGNLGLY